LLRWHMATRYSAEVKAEARRLRTAGMSANRIARFLGVSRSSVSGWTQDVAAAVAGDQTSAVPRLAERTDLRDRAIELRRQGLSTAQIAKELGIRRGSTLAGWLVGTPAPDWTKRSRAKDELRMRARELRADGATYPEIAEQLGVSKSSVSLWVRDIPAPPRQAASARHARRMGSAYWVAENARRDAAREEVKAEAAREIGALSRRELLLVGAALYWAEGSKDKAYARRERLVFINSDVRVIRTYLAWLDAMDVDPERRSYRLSIHESADVKAATEFWSEAIGVRASSFRSPTLKRHKAMTVRLNVGADYHGCLIVEVAKSRVEYQRMDGIFRAIAEAAEVGPPPGPRCPPRSDTSAPSRPVQD
jgi:predicted transcriptional regulator